MHANTSKHGRIGTKAYSRAAHGRALARFEEETLDAIDVAADAIAHDRGLVVALDELHRYFSQLAEDARTKQQWALAITAERHATRYFREMRKAAATLGEPHGRGAVSA